MVTLLALLACADGFSASEDKGPGVDTPSDSAPPDTGVAPDDPTRVDDDGDGWSEVEGDCDDADPDVSPGATEACEDRVDDDCDGVPDDGCVEGTAQRWWTGRLVTGTDGSFTSAAFGYSFYGLSVERTVCSLTGSLAYEDTAPAGCPDCLWSFDLGPVAASSATSAGRGCEALGVVDGAIDGEFDYAWGFAPSYDYDYGGRVFEARNVVFLWFADAGQWYPFAFDEPAYGVDRVVGDAQDVRFAFPSAGGLEYYSYAP